MPVTIKTNNQWRDLVYRADVPAKVLETDFAYHKGREIVDGYFCYRGHWYHIDHFMECSRNHDLRDWDGYASDSYFSGVVIKLSSDGEQIKVGTYFS